MMGPLTGNSSAISPRQAAADQSTVLDQEKRVQYLLFGRKYTYTDYTYPQVHNIWWQGLGQRGR